MGANGRDGEPSAGGSVEIVTARFRVPLSRLLDEACVATGARGLAMRFRRISIC